MDNNRQGETENFGETLRQYRKDNFLTQKQMAKLLGLSSNHIGTLECGKKKPRASTIAAFEAISGKKDWKNWRGGDETESMSETSLETYARIWQGLNSLEEEQKKEVLNLFSRILDWL